MNDTSPEMEEKFRKLMMQKSGEERVKMGFSMMTASRKIMLSAIERERPGLPEWELRREFFLRFYGQDYPEKQREKIAARFGEPMSRPPQDSP